MTDHTGAHTPERPFSSGTAKLFRSANRVHPSNRRPDLPMLVKLTYAEVHALSSTDPAMAEELERLRKASAEYDLEIQQILGRALGYPKYCDDKANFSDATEADGVCVGEHVAVTLAQEAAKELERYRAIKVADRPDFEAAHYLIETQKAELERLRAEKAQMLEAFKPLIAAYSGMIQAYECPNQADVYYGLWKGRQSNWETARAAILAAGDRADG